MSFSFDIKCVLCYIYSSMIDVKLLSITANAEKLIEECGRTAYLSVGVRNSDSTARFIRMLIKSGHLSVLEHASASFRIKGGSRAFTHQLVRHRMASFTQQSQRYVNENNFSFVIPQSIENNNEAKKLFISHLENTKYLYNQLLSIGIKKEDARFVLPNAIESEIVITANFREWRHILFIRGEKQAQWEIRKIAIDILKALKLKAPNCFYDMKIEDSIISIDKTGKY